MKRVYFLTFLVLGTLVADAQSFYAIRRERSLILSVGTGTSTYFGELKNPGDYLDAKPNLSVGLQYFVSPRIALRAELDWFQLAGDDAEADDTFNGRKGRNLSFVSNNYELTLGGAFNIFPNGRRYYQRHAFNFYGFAAVGFVYINPTTELDGVKYALQPLQTEGISYSRFQPVVPYGLGAKVKLGPFFNIAIEGGYRMVFTDYLDDVSTVHPDKTGWVPTRIALSDRRSEINLDPYPVGARRGNPETNDGYFLMNFKVEYYLPVQFGNSSQRFYKQKRKSMYRRSRSR